jgi:CelD/BcsL family acetyltransferase involved in cellulose biosynthesis
MMTVPGVGRITNDGGSPAKTGKGASSARPAAPGNTARGAAYSARLLDGFHDPLFEKAAIEGNNVFHGAPFLEALARHILSGSDRLILVGVTDSAGNPLAMFPFVKRRKFGVAALEAVDFGVVDFFAPILFRATPLSAAETAKLWRTAVDAVPGVHAVAFKKLPRLLHGRPHALSAADFLKPMGTSATTLFLRNAAGEPTGSMDSASVERKLKKASRVLQRFGPLTFEEAQTKEDAEAYLKVLVCFRTARFKELGRYDALLDSNVVDFYRTLADRNTEGAPGRLFALRAGDEIVAVTYGFAYRDAFTLIAPAITPKAEYQSGSPGLIAMFRTLGWCQDNGFGVFDLSVGSLSYKSRFEADSIDLFEYQEALSPLGLPVVVEGWLRRQVRYLALKHPKLRTTLEKLRRRSGDKAREPKGHA